MVRLLNTAMHYPGFAWPYGMAFEDPKVAESARVIIIGPGTVKPPRNKVRKISEARVLSFFKVVLELEGLYKATDGSDLFWEAVLKRWNGGLRADGKEVEGAHAKEVADYIWTNRLVFKCAERFHKTKDEVTELTAVMDQFSDLHADTYNLHHRTPSEQQTTLPIRSA